MVETDTPVVAGKEVGLERNGNSAQGAVVWNRPGLIGIRFNQPIYIDRWLGLSARPRAETWQPVQVALKESSPEQQVLERLAEELAFIERSLNGIADLLSDDPILRVRHASRIQELCLGEQMLREICGILKAEHKVSAIKKNATGSMRNRLLRRNEQF